MVEMLKGIAASDGVAVAKAYLLVQPAKPLIPEADIC